MTYLGQLGQIALAAADAERTLAYYRDVVGLPFLFRYDHLIFFDCGGVRLFIECGAKNEGQPRSGCLYFKVPDIDRAYTDLKERGVIFDDKPHLIARMPDHELWMAFFKDPDANQLAIMCEKR
jgi:methylmalonyl-CoA/ethylmalonyl-CoA epimerase